MNKGCVSVLLLWSASVFSAPTPTLGFSGTWDCVMTSSDDPEGYSVTSRVIIDISKGIFERKGDIKFRFKEMGGFNVHEKTYEQGTIRIDGASIIFSPLKVHSEVVESGPLPKSFFSDANGELLEDGTSKILSITSDTYSILNESGSVDTCARHS